jgi:hypothetical protein
MNKMYLAELSQEIPFYVPTYFRPWEDQTEDKY